MLPPVPGTAKNGGQDDSDDDDAFFGATDPAPAPALPGVTAGSDDDHGAPILPPLPSLPGPVPDDAAVRFSDSEEDDDGFQ